MSSPKKNNNKKKKKKIQTRRKGKEKKKKREKRKPCSIGKMGLVEAKFDGLEIGSFLDIMCSPISRNPSGCF
jgi:hypothetical protein